jgi:hypothetical protein
LLPTEEEIRRKRKSLLESIKLKEKIRDIKEDKTRTEELTDSKNI